MMYTRLPFLPRPLEIKYCFKRSIWLDILSLHFGHYGAFRIGRSKKYYLMQSVTAKKLTIFITGCLPMILKMQKFIEESVRFCWVLSSAGINWASYLYQGCFLELI